MVSFEVEETFLRAVDAFIVSSGKYSSRSEFLKDSARRNMEWQLEVDANMKKFLKGIKKLRKQAYANGYDGHMPTREERAKIADEYLKEKGITLDR